MDARTFQRLYSARLAIGIAKRAKLAAERPMGTSFVFALRFPRAVTQYLLAWDFIQQHRESDIATAVLILMRSEAVRMTKLGLD